MSTTTAGDWTLSIDDGGTAWLCLDRRDASANTLSMQVMAQLDALLDDLRRVPPRGVVIYSGKTQGFIAGADINEFPQLETAETGFRLTRQGQAVLDKLAALPCATVAFLNGTALGGGLELALACTWRLALHGHEPVFGLPEVQLGLHPGLGGTVRATQLLGVRVAMDLMLTGRSLRPAAALSCGLVDELVTADTWREAAARRLQAERPVRRMPLVDRFLNIPPLRPLLARSLQRKVAQRASAAHYPAPYAIIDLWRRHGGAPHTESYIAEARSFGELVMTPTSRNLVRVFHLQNRLKRASGTAFRAGRVHVVGAGIMGGDIAAWCALRGIDVTLQDREMAFIEPALTRAEALFRRKLREPGAAAAARGRLRADPGGEGVGSADVVIEAIFEDRAAKQDLYRHIEPAMRPGALLATNTSSIPLEALGEGLADPGRFIGLHFFNPVAKLPLVEVVRARDSSDLILDRGLAFVRQIGKLPLPCRSHPGFLVNRILAPYMAEAMVLLREGVPPAAIDAAATEFGMPMGPVELADTVGLDVALHVARVLAPVIRRPQAPELEALVARGHLGRKSGQGFYVYREGKPVRPHPAHAGADPDITNRLMLSLVNEAAQCLAEEIVEDADLVDAGVIFGTGFAPFRGGPLHHARSTGVTTIRAQLDALARRHGERFAPSTGWDLLHD